ncbi:MAG: hypothetical protein Q8N79_04350 [Candidatus Methanoperedens sp.]|nr:hypothetical protein [Candidatus Methanoperedens sp.]
MRKMGGIRILLAALLMASLVGLSAAAPSLSNSGGGAWKYQRDKTNKENSVELVRGDNNGRNDSKAAKRY